MKTYFTSESVTEGHPDKMCDYIADKILDEYLKKDENSKVAVEVLASKDRIIIAGQVTSNAQINIEEIVRKTIQEIGYDNDKIDMNYRTCKIDINISKQSIDIENKVNNGGAGDQGIMFGYACNETTNYMPLAIELAHKIAKQLTLVRKTKQIDYLRPDGKVQVTIEYENDVPKRVDTIIISTQHLENVNMEELRKDIYEKVIKPILVEYENIITDEFTKIYINAKGKFVIGGPLADTGLTGRKIIIDTYGGYSRHGGGAFSGKDPSKVDRSASYMLRHIAKSIVANGLAKKCELQLSYLIGEKEPISIWINTFGTNTISEDKILDIIKRNFDLTPEGIISYLKLKQPIYSKTTNYGHFGKEEMSWEKIIKLKDM